jgi:outer membrane protein assembly factor BamB
LKLFLTLLLTTLVGCSSIDKIKNVKSPFDTQKRELSDFIVRWSKNLDPVYNTGNLPIGSSSPMIHEDILYMGNLSGEMTAYDLENGVELWKAQQATSINAKATIFGDNVIYGTMSGRLVSRHYLTGALNYAIDLGAPIESEIVTSGGRMYVHLRNHKIVAMDASTGKVFWGYKRSVPFVTTLQRVSKVLPFKDKLVVGFADGNLVALSRDEGIILWSQKVSAGVKFVDVDASPVYFNGFIVSGSANDKLRFINPSNGVIVKTINIVIGHSPIRVGEELIVGSVYGEIGRIDKNGKLIYKRKLVDSGISSIVPWKDGYAVATMGGQIHQVNKKSFETKEIFELGYAQSAVFGFLQRSGEYLSVYSSRNRLYVFKNIQ